jgi:pSer/pThr/pTyr-binding forkhead associated (FHA) protein
MMMRVWIRDPRRGRLIIRTFHRSPVTVGESAENILPLRGRGVSRHHGALLFDGGVVSYIDFGSGGGSTIDGSRLPADRDVELPRQASLTIGPFVLEARAVALDLSCWLRPSCRRSSSRDRRPAP